MKTKAMVGTLALTFLLLPSTTFAQQRVDPALIQQFRADLERGLANSSITDNQKQRIEDDLAKLRQARENHKRRAARSAFRDLKSQIEKANFKEADREKLQEDIQQIRAARQQ